VFVSSLNQIEGSRRNAVNFINILRARFSYESLFGSFFSSYVLAKKALSYKKCVRKMLMKLTHGGRKEGARGRRGSGKKPTWK